VYLKRKEYFKNIFKEITVEENHKRVSGSKFGWTTLFGTPSRKFIGLNCKFADSIAGVAPNTYPKPIGKRT
jgi:hypothetical protein